MRSTQPYEFSSPAFRMDNNLIGIDHDEAIRCPQSVLKTEIDTIANEFSNVISHDASIKPIHRKSEKATVSATVVAATTTVVKSPVEDCVDLKRCTHQDRLERLADIYSAIIDFNLTTNILSEFAFLLNLLNADYDRNSSEEVEQPKSTAMEIDEIICTNGNNCVYLCIGVLKRQKHILIMLDVTTIKILMDNDRLARCEPALSQLLAQIYGQKSKMDSVDWMHVPADNLNVSYQQENDTKHNFPSAREFIAFNKQRDMFYTILR